MLSAALLLMGAATCQKQDVTEEATPSEEDYQRSITERPLPEEGHLLQEIDLNSDGSPDIYNYFRERENAPRLMLRKEIDLDRDGRVDVRTYFTDEGTLEREEMDGDFDGHFDWVDHYQSGERVMSEQDTDNDGQMNVFSYYEKGKITRKERDTNADGLIDYWERFDAEGNVTKIGRDTDGDGKLDERDE